MSFAGLPATRDLSGAWYAVMDIDRDTAAQYATPSDFAKAPADEAWVYSCVRRLYQSAMGVPLRVYVRVGKDLIPASDEPSPEGDDLQALLDYVNPVDMTGSDLKAYTVASYAIWGESFWRKVRGRFGGPPQELYWLRAVDVSVDSDDGRTPKSYTYQPVTAAARETYKPRDIVPFRTPNLANPLRGLSPLSSVGQEIATGRQWAQRVNATLANDGVPPGYWQIPPQAEFSEQDQRLVTRVLRSLRGPKNKGKTPVMPKGMEFKDIALSPHDAEMVAARKISRMAVCAALGVPLVLAGDDEKSTVYANLRDAERVFWRGTMIPLLDGYADVINNWLVPDFDPSRRRLVVGFDYSDVESLRPTLDLEWNMWLNAQGAQAIVPNEFRRHFRLGKDLPWGDRPTPRVAINVRPDPASLPPNAIPGIDPADIADLPTSMDAGPVDEVEPLDVAASLRAFGANLYKHPAVKAWIAGASLDTRSLVGGSVTDAHRAAIEAGLRRRDKAAVIAAAIEEAA